VFQENCFKRSFDGMMIRQHMTSSCQANSYEKQKVRSKISTEVVLVWIIAPIISPTFGFGPLEYKRIGNRCSSNESDKNVPSWLSKEKEMPLSPQQPLQDYKIPFSKTTKMRSKVFCLSVEASKKSS
jgi:hypothetical protein